MGTRRFRKQAWGSRLGETKANMLTSRLAVSDKNAAQGWAEFVMFTLLSFHKGMYLAWFSVTQSVTSQVKDMNSLDFSLHYHEIKFKNELHSRTGKSFQDFFERIMEKADRSFQMVKPVGRVGDWKSDGFSTRTGTVYQCYAPERLTSQKAADKVAEDFEGAKACWKNKMKGWVFVWSSYDALPPQVISILADIKKANGELMVSDLSREGLWNIVKELSLIERVSLLGSVPTVDAVPLTTAAEIQVLMTHLGRQAFTPLDSADLDLTAIIEKLKKNNLSASVAAIMRPAMPVAKLVSDFVAKMPDPDFSQRIATDLAGKYLEFQSRSNDTDATFGALVEYSLSGKNLEPKFFWAAAGIVTHYFELCDLFER